MSITHGKKSLLDIQIPFHGRSDMNYATNNPHCHRSLSVVALAKYGNQFLLCDAMDAYSEF